MKQLFFSGQFTTFLQQLISTNQSFFVDGIHIAMALMNLNMLKTKPQLAYLLSHPKAKEELLAKYDKN